MNRYIYILFLSLLFITSCNPDYIELPVKQAYLDLTEMNDSNIYALNGEWEFYYDTLLTPSQIKTTSLVPQLVEVPALWSTYNLPEQGKATYRIKLKLSPDSLYTIKISGIYLSYKVFINNREIVEVGKVTPTSSNFQADDRSKICTFNSGSGDVEIVIQIANYIFRKGGIGNSVIVANPNAMSKYDYYDVLLEVFMVGALTFMMLFYFILFFYNKKIISSLYFSLLLLTIVITTGFSGELFFSHFLHLNWVLGSKIWTVFSYLSPLFLMLYVESLTSNTFSSTIKKISVYFVVIFSLFIIVSPVAYYTKTLFVLILFSIFSIIYAIYVLYKNIKNNKDNIFALVGLLVILLATINDFLYDYRIINTGYIVFVGMFIFAMMQAFLLSIKNAGFFTKAKNLTDRIQIHNTLRDAMLQIPSYETNKLLKIFAETLRFEKVILFYKNGDDIFIKDIICKNTNYKKGDNPININTENEYFCVNGIKEALRSKESIFFQSNSKVLKKYSVKYNYFKENNLKSLIIIPIITNEEIRSILYIENRQQMIGDAQMSILKSSYPKLKNLEFSSIAYSKLQSANQNLEKDIEEQTQKAEKQKFEIDLKNQELDKKIQLLEEQYVIQQEINDELEEQNKELSIQNDLLENQNKKIIKQKKEVEKRKSYISENIQYASIILNALKQQEGSIPFSDFFMVDLPKDIIGGDFYWSKQVGDKFLFVLADSTGHGVPGALMRLLGIMLLNRTIDDFQMKNKDFTPADILNMLRTNLKNILTHNNSETIKDGYDMSFCMLDVKTNELTVSGAYNPVFVIRAKKLITLKTDRMPIGEYLIGYEVPFKNTYFKLQKNDKIYIFTDGFVDQFGGEEYTKFYLKNLKQLLLTVSEKPFKLQKQTLTNTFNNWKGSGIQIDDVGILAFSV